MVYILDKEKQKLIDAEIIFAKKEDIPLKKEGWSFNWRQLVKTENSQTFVLKLINSYGSVEGALLISLKEGMLVMDTLEVAPHNVGSQKRYDYVAGSLIAFACRKSFKIEGAYKGFLTFTSKTNLIPLYVEKYGAESSLGQRMFISDENGILLIEKYLNRKEIDDE